MTLGETIHQLRTSRGMSQGDLADALEVSRQSVSKWETDASVPDLDKLVQLSRLFDVTLDQLVCGAEAQPKAGEEPVQPETPKEKKGPTPVRRIVGAVLLAVGLLSEDPEAAGAVVRLGRLPASADLLDHGYLYHLASGAVHSVVHSLYELLAPVYRLGDAGGHDRPDYGHRPKLFRPTKAARPRYHRADGGAVGGGAVYLAHFQPGMQLLCQ